MSTNRVPTKYRDIVRMAREAGFEHARSRGDHDMYRHPDGRLISVPFKRQGEVSRPVASSVVKIIQYRGPLFGRGGVP